MTFLRALHLSFVSFIFFPTCCSFLIFSLLSVTRIVFEVWFLLFIMCGYITLGFMLVAKVYIFKWIQIVLKVSQCLIFWRWHWLEEFHLGNIEPWFIVVNVLNFYYWTILWQRIGQWKMPLLLLYIVIVFECTVYSSCHLLNHKLFIITWGHNSCLAS